MHRPSLVLAARRADFDAWFSQHGVKILAYLLVAILGTIVARLLVRRFARRLEGKPSLTQELNLQRAATLAHALSASFVVIIWAIGILLVLGELDVPLAPLLTSAGVAGVALGFGAQSLVRDTLSGFFILLENQFGVGDVVGIQTVGGPVSGKIESLTLRVTTLRDFDGTLHVVPNGNIQFVSNKSRNWARAIVDVRVAYGEDVDRLRRILEELFDEIRLDEEMRDWIMEGPSILGVETLADYAITVRIVAQTRPSKRWDTERRLRERITVRLSERGIRVPMPPAIAHPGQPPGQPR
ncbi:MAG TPA: mechanosensitive ion channel family protein [Actinomycetota bacterium]|nr:mechanosensitive ion channel family protein [Actinomycetota bacterium]